MSLVRREYRVSVLGSVEGKRDRRKEGARESLGCRVLWKYSGMGFNIINLRDGELSWVREGYRLGFGIVFAESRF